VTKASVAIVSRQRRIGRAGNGARSKLCAARAGRFGPGLLVLTGALAGFVWSSPAGARPQASLGLTLGGAFETDPPAPDRSTEFELGARADVLFARSRGFDMGVGPYVEAATLAFRRTDLGGGGEWLLPVRDDLPLVLSAGAFARRENDATWAPGGEGSVFFGSRSYNFHSWYGLAIGVFAQTLYVPGPDRELDVVIGARIDGELLVLPWLLVAGLLHQP
jgi:hypothetical protein